MSIPAAALALAVISSMSAGGNLPRKKPSLRRYSTFCGPPYPTSRQHRRAMQRASSAALARIAATKDVP